MFPYMGRFLVIPMPTASEDYNIRSDGRVNRAGSAVSRTLIVAEDSLNFRFRSRRLAGTTL